MLILLEDMMETLICLQEDIRLMQIHYGYFSLDSILLKLDIHNDEEEAIMQILIVILNSN